MKKNYIVLFVIGSVLLSIIMACQSDSYTPKPKGFFRISLPEKEYRMIDSNFPFTFEYPIYAHIEKSPNFESYVLYERFNIEFPAMKGTLHISYEEIDNNLDLLVEDAVEFVYKHVQKASAIPQKIVERPEDKVFGNIFEIKGNQTASTYQFYLTDSTNHYLRGALYFKIKPANDSLQPVINFIKEDVNHLIKTLKWK